MIFKARSEILKSDAFSYPWNSFAGTLHEPKVKRRRRSSLISILRVIFFSQLLSDEYFTKMKNRL